MTNSTPANPKPTFRSRLQSGEPLVGTMLKIPTSHATEILSLVGFDFVVVDQEHSPFDRASIDVLLLAGRAAGIPVLVRVSGPDMILSACDGGASGVIVPHVKDVAYGARVAASCRYRGGTRGYATSTRAGGYTSLPMARHIQESDALISMIAQIEDPAAVDAAAAIAAVAGIDSLFIGRNDLACAYGDDSIDSPSVRAAVERIAAAARAAKKPLGVFISKSGEIEWLKSLGATLFIFSSDQGLLRAGAAKALSETRDSLRT